MYKRHHIIFRNKLLFSAFLFFVVFVLLFLLTVRFGDQVLEEYIQDTAANVVTNLEIIHTESMINRSDTMMRDDVVKSLDKITNKLSAEHEYINLWLVMGPKVKDYQLQHGGEYEKEVDKVDEAAIREAKTIKQYINEDVYRVSKPVILGQGKASHARCYMCHNGVMGVEEGEVIGLYSVSYNTSDLRKNFQEKLVIISLIFLSVLLVIILLLYFICYKESSEN